MREKFDDHLQIAVLLKEALSRMQEGSPQNAAWRIADAGLLLRRSLEDSGHENLIGLDRPTGRGAVLPDEGENA
jgi:hypothetical protein